MSKEYEYWSGKNEDQDNLLVQSQTDGGLYIHVSQHNGFAYSPSAMIELPAAEVEKLKAFLDSL